MGADVSVVGNLSAIKNQGKVWVVTKDMGSVNAGARSSLTNITSVMFNKIKIVGVAAVSSVNTDWRFKFYKKDTGIVTSYTTDTYIGDVEITSMSATADTYYEGSVESSLYYWDQDMTSEMHIIAENIGSTNGSVFVNILYTEAD